jgi:ABC-type uncharacterized transport system ATPase component
MIKKNLNSKVLFGKDLYSRVTKYLMNNSDLRDSDSKLMARIWYDEVQTTLGLIATAEELLIAVSKGQLTNWESATRCRRKIQEEVPELRGQNHSLRKDKAKRVKEGFNAPYNRIL